MGEITEESVKKIIQNQNFEQNIASQKSHFDQLCDVSNVKTTDAEFDAELQVYSEMPSVSIGADVRSYYGQTNSIISSAVNEIKHAGVTMNSKFQSLTYAQTQKQDSAESIQELNKQIREAKIAYDRTMPFTQSAKSAKDRYDNLRRQKIKAIQKRRKNRSTIKDLSTELKAQKAKVAELKARIEEATKKRDKIIAMVRKQFRVVDKIKGQYQFLKHVADLNQYSGHGNGTKEYNAIKSAQEFEKIFTSKGTTLTISILSPLHEYSLADLQNKDRDPDEVLNPILVASAKTQEAFEGLKIPTKMPPATMTFEQGTQSQVDEIQKRTKNKVQQLQQIKDGSLELPNPDKEGR